MKKVIILSVIAVLATCSLIHANNVQEARGVILRAVGYFPKNVVLTSISRDGDTDRYATYTRKGIL